MTTPADNVSGSDVVKPIELNKSDALTALAATIQQEADATHIADAAAAAAANTNSQRDWMLNHKKKQSLLKEMKWKNWGVQKNSYPKGTEGGSRKRGLNKSKKSKKSRKYRKYSKKSRRSSKKSKSRRRK